MKLGKSIIGMAALLSAGAVCAEQAEYDLIAVGELLSEQRSVSDFEVVDLKGIGELHIERAPASEQGLWVQAQSDLMPYIHTEVVNGVLHIDTNPEYNLHSMYPIEYHLKVSDIERIALSGNTSVETNGPYQTNHLRLELQDRATAVMDIEADEVDMHLTGASVLKAKGHVAKQQVFAENQSAYKGDALTTQKTTLQLKGAAKADVEAVQSLQIVAEDTSAVSYKGAPAVDTQEISSGATVKAIS